MTVKRQAGAAALLAAALVFAGCGGGGGGGSEPPPASGTETPFDDDTTYSTQATASLASANEGAAVTRRSITLGGTAIAYTTKAGHLTASHPTSGAPQASFFYVAYTADGAAAATRPVTFFYNGGPGSASVWLHLGSFGPKRLAANAPSTDTPTPFAFVDNNESLLDTTDLVFVDAVGTGLSQAIAPNTNQSFWGVDTDAAVFRDFVRRYVQAHGREGSPKFLFGESYGTTRSAVLAQLLESAGIALHGVVLQSSVLDYNRNCAVTGEASESCGSFVPSYAATGAHYRLLVPQPADVPAFLATMREFTAATYEPAVAAYIGSNVLPDAALLQRLSETTGAATSLWQSNFNLDPTTFQYRLVGGRLIGRYDARMSAPLGSELASEGDPSSTFITSSFASTMQSYLRDTLRYTSRSSYAIFSNDAINAWDFRHDGLALPDTVPDLAAALAQNPALAIFSVSGHHDLATPFHQTERDLARLGPVANLTIRNYDGGHMTYLDDRSRVQQKSDLREFYRQAQGVR